MKIGLPRAMLYYRYRVLWETFFHELGCETVTSWETNRKILRDGIKYSIDECCLPSKIFMGHVYSLIGKCDYILIPRYASCRTKNDVCVKLNALYDIAKNTFENACILDYNVDVHNGESEKKGFLQMGRRLGISYFKTISAYRKAKSAQIAEEKRRRAAQAKLLAGQGGTKLLIVSHPYNIYDKLIGYPITELVRNQGGICVYADAEDKEECLARADKLSESLYWLYNRELIGSIKLLERSIDGIILLTAFPCGPDSLVNELVIRKAARIPTINIIIDELQSEAGLQTRIESFLDIIKEKNRLKSG